MGLETLRVRGNIPQRANPTDAGMDLVSADTSWFQTIHPGGSFKFDTGTAVDLPEGYVGLVFSRSGLGSNGVRVRNGVGVIDQPYKSNIHVKLENVSEEPVTIEPGDRIAQLVIVPVETPGIVQVSPEEWPDEDRGGFGSTGVK